VPPLHTFGSLTSTRACGRARAIASLPPCRRDVGRERDLCCELRLVLGELACRHELAQERLRSGHHEPPRDLGPTDLGEDRAPSHDLASRRRVKARAGGDHHRSPE
jgi:hypothetical protein